jgi:hypothetical protein
MSTIPYNKYTVRDLTNNKQPYVNSTREVGYFNGTSVGTIPINKWYSLPAVLNTNNGIANVDASGVRILNAGIYSINLSLFPTTTQDVSSNISFNFGTTYLSNISTNVLANSFGGVEPTGMFTYDASNNYNTPGIISWVADGYSSGNSGSNFVKTQTNELSYNYYTAGTGGQIFSGICTTEITFFIDEPTTIYFNVSGNSTTVTMNNCFFTLQLISTYYFPSLLIWTQRGITNGLPSSANWSSIASSSDGTRLAAVVDGGSGITSGIYTSSDYGANWRQTNAGIRSWTSIASSGTGQYLAAVVTGTSGGIWTSTNSGLIWEKKINGVPTPNPSWNSIASSSSGQYLIACTKQFEGFICISGDYGENWQRLGEIHDLPITGYWISVASSSSGQYLAAIGQGTLAIWTSINYGVNWIQKYAASGSWKSITLSETGQYLAAVASQSGGGIYTSDTSGNSWVKRSNGLPTNVYWFSIASSSSGQYLAAAASNDAGYTNGNIYLSSDYGDNWILQGTNKGLPSNQNWESIASSSDGSRLASCIGNGTIYTKLNF